MTREEAIGIIRRCCPKISDSECDFETAMRVLIPELNESDDERIRRELIEEVGYLLPHEEEYDDEGRVLSTYEKRIGRYRAWLEKQKEQKPSDLPAGFYFIDKDGNKYYSKEFRFNNGTFTTTMKVGEEQKPSGKPSRQEYLYHLLANGVITFSDYEFLMRNKGRKPADLPEMMVHKEPYIAPVPTPMVADEQKPAEWSESDKQNINLIISYLDSYIKEHNDTFGADECKYLKYWLKSLHERFNLEPKPEWSEEDKKMQKSIDLSLDCYSEGKLPALVMQISREREWINSLPERFNLQSKQEWSDEEMKVLDSIIDDYEAASKSFCGYDGKIGLLREIRDSEYNLPKQEWNEEDERMFSRCIKSIETSKQFADSATFKRAKDKEIDWLENRIKSFRPVKQEWNEEDEEMLQSIIKDFRAGKVSTIGQEQWLKSLRPSWKPSEHQMTILKAVKDYVGVGSGYWGESLGSLIEDLEKLMH